MRVVDTEGNQLGILAVEEAMRIADEKGLDLVEIAPKAKPPVCKIIDYGKFKYEQQKKVREGKKKQHMIQVKEIRMRPNIESHDFEFKIRNARKFLEGGDKVKVTIVFQGRQIVHQELGHRVMTNAEQALSDLAKLEAPPKREGRSIVAHFVKK